MAGLLSTIVQKLLRQNVSANKRERKKEMMDKLNLFGTEIPLVKEETTEQAEDIELFAEKENAAAEEAADGQGAAKTNPVVDSFLGKIDEFRAKAKQLQELLATREEKAQELQNIVEQREDKAQELQQILDERQEKADGLTAEVAGKVDELIAEISAKMDEIRAGVQADAKESAKAQEAQLKDLFLDQNAGIKGALDSQSAQLQVSLDAQRKSLQETSGVISEIKAQGEETNRNLSAGVDAINGSLAEISEKIHSENVKSFRNTVDLFKELEDKLDVLENLEQKVRSAKNLSVCVFAISLVNLLAVVALLALNLIF